MAVAKNIGICCTLICALVGIVAIVLAWVLVHPYKDYVYDSVFDLMFIDDTVQDTDGKGEKLAERYQFNEWMKQSTQQRTFSVFTVTNAQAVVASGAKPVVKELGAVYAKKLTTTIMSDAQKAEWDSTGIATYREAAAFQLDEGRCLVDCKALLDQYITIPNPVWARVADMKAVPALVVVQWIGFLHQFHSAKLTAVVGAIMTTLGVSQTEAGAIANGVLVPLGAGNSMTAMNNVGALLVAAQMMASCSIGGLSMDNTRCRSIAAALMVQVGKFWPVLLGTYSAAYNTSAAPVFIRAKVRDVLNYQSTVTDPMLKIDITFPALRDSTTPAGQETSMQMSSRFGELGTSVYVRYDGAVHDCRVDKDCWPGGRVEALSTPGACNVGGTCQPLQFAHYTQAAIPGNNFGTERGFSGWGPGKKYPIVVDGVALEAIIKGESDELVNGDKLRYLEVRANKIMRRLENCDGAGNGAPGIDCETPLSTAYQGHKLSGSPVFASSPMFSTVALEDVAGTNAGHNSSSAYDPLTRISLERCTGNSWCDEGRPEKFRALLKVEPETGFTFEGSIAAQINIRIVPDAIHTNVNDALIPVYWYLVEKKAEEDDMEQLVTLQGAPGLFNRITIGVFIGGILLFLCGTIGSLLLKGMRR